VIRYFCDNCHIEVPSVTSESYTGAPITIALPIWKRGNYLAFSDDGSATEASEVRSFESVVLCLDCQDKIRDFISGKGKQK